MREFATTYTTSVAKVTYEDGRVKEVPLSYNVLFSVSDKVAEVNGSLSPAGQLYNYKMEPLPDPMGNPVVAETRTPIAYSISMASRFWSRTMSMTGF